MCDCNIRERPNKTLTACQLHTYLLLTKKNDLEINKIKKVKTESSLVLGRLLLAKLSGGLRSGNPR